MREEPDIQNVPESLIDRIAPKYRPVWEGQPAEVQAALARYFLPHKSSKASLAPTRPRVIKWYCPFASQADFPRGHRYCVNVYTGCAHNCHYCYAQGYAPESPSPKKDFEKMLMRDVEDLERFDVPPAPVHLSNSTDPFQPLEAELGHTRYALTQLLAHRRRFTTVTVLTKNPLMAAQLGYIDLFRDLVDLPSDHPHASSFREKAIPAFCVEVSLAFWRDEARAAYDPRAPSVEERRKGIRALRAAGVPVVLRIDPLFPSLSQAELPGKTYADFGLTQPQTREDIESLVAFARRTGVRHVVYSAAKIVRPRGRGLSDTMRAMRLVYEQLAAPRKLIWRGGSWRLPPEVMGPKVIRPFFDTCRRLGVVAKLCKDNLVSTP